MLKRGTAQAEPLSDAEEAEALASIIEEVAASEGGPPVAEPDPLAALSEKVDLLIADAGRWNEYKGASAEYIKEFTTEIRWHRRIRLGVAIFAGFLIALLFAGLVLALLFRVDLFGKDPGHALTALIVATIGGCVIIAIAVAKGAFATVSDRNAGLPMPDHMKEVVDAAKGLWKT